MKKMLIIAAVVITAGLSQAAQLAWAVNGVQKVDASGHIADGAYGFAFTGSEANRQAVIALLGTATWATDFQAAVNSLTYVTAASNVGADSHLFLGSARSLAATGNITSSTAYGGVPPNVFQGSTQQSVYFVAFDSGTDWKLATHYTVSKLYTQTLQANGSKTYGLTWSTNFGDGSTPGTWVATVPEPTSMALLALGAAAIGLRRKFSK